MADKKLVNINWGAIGAVAGVAGAVAGVAGVVAYVWFQYFYLPTPSISPSALTATIKSYPYRHAQTEIFEREEVWREQWLQPLEYKLKKRSIAPELLDTVVAAMEDLINEKMEREVRLDQMSIARSWMWYSVTITNDGDVPLKDVFLKFPAADFWVDERHRLAFIRQRIEIGDMDQKSEKRFTFWGGHLGSLPGNEKVVLGHSDGIGTIDFD